MSTYHIYENLSPRLGDRVVIHKADSSQVVTVATTPNSPKQKTCVGCAFKKFYYVCDEVECEDLIFKEKKNDRRKIHQPAP